MKKTTVYFFTAFFLLTILFISCKKSDQQKETMLSGQVDIYVDESLKPIIEDQINIFQNTYKNSNLNLIEKPEGEIINSLIDNKSKIAILTRLLTKEEEKTFTNQKITPKLTRFAIDGVAIITNSKSQDSLIELDQVLAYIKGEPSQIKALVVDNPNSSATRLLHDKAGINVGSNKSIYSKSSSEELLKFISENEGYIGVLGINWLTQIPQNLKQYTENITVLKVKNVKTETEDTNYYYPSQFNMGKKLYPLSREIYLLNYQGNSGLGMGFASFVASDIGQKIILTSGLAPVKLQPMEVNVKK